MVINAPGAAGGILIRTLSGSTKPTTREYTSTHRVSASLARRVQVLHLSNTPSVQTFKRPEKALDVSQKC